MKSTILYCAVLIGLTGFRLFGAEVSLDASKSYQTIEGLGGFALNGFDNESLVEKYVKDLGVTMIRINTGDAAQSTDYWIKVLKLFYKHADAIGEPLKVIATTWSPPAHMKINGKVSGMDPKTNKLKRNYYDDYAGVVSKFLSDIKKGTGRDIYAVSLQNEPQFPEPYWSCVYTDVEYHDLLKVCGPIIRRDHPKIKFFGSETMAHSGNIYLKPTMQDPVTRELLHAVAYHGYSDGVNPSPNSQAASVWTQAGGLAGNFDKSLWMTETSGYDGNWNGGLQLAITMYMSMKYGNLNGWTYWIMNNSKDSGFSGNGNPNALYHASKQYFKFVRPGAIRLESACANDDISPLVFAHPEKKTLTWVILNTGGSAQSITLKGANLPATFKMYVSSGSLSCASQGSKSASESITLPAKSVTTLVGTGYSYNGTHAAIVHPTIHSSRVAPVNRTGKVYGLNGRIVRTTNTMRSGLYLSRSIDTESARLLLVP